MTINSNQERNQFNVLDSMRARVRHVNEANGWFASGRTFGEDIALLHSEVSEAFEEYRDHGTQRYVKIVDALEDGIPVNLHLGDGIEYGTDLETGKPYKPLGVPSEMADILIRLLDTCDRYDVDLSAEFEAKLAYNATRGYKHGGKVI